MSYVEAVRAGGKERRGGNGKEDERRRAKNIER